jgi:alkylhydroperoxidase family enzyme
VKILFFLGARLAAADRQLVTAQSSMAAATKAHAGQLAARYVRSCSSCNDFLITSRRVSQIEKILFELKNANPSKRLNLVANLSRCIQVYIYY